MSRNNWRPPPSPLSSSMFTQSLSPVLAHSDGRWPKYQQESLVTYWKTTDMPNMWHTILVWRGHISDRITCRWLVHTYMLRRRPTSLCPPGYNLTQHNHSRYWCWNCTASTSRYHSPSDSIYWCWAQHGWGRLLAHEGVHFAFCCQTVHHGKSCTTPS